MSNLKKKLLEQAAKASKKLDEIGYRPEDAAKTQVTNTKGTYVKARDMLDDLGVGDDVLDYGAGKGHGTPILRGESYEPYPQGDFAPDYTTPPNKLYDAVVNLNVLNVLPPELRDQVAMEILDRIRMEGYGLISARGQSGLSSLKNPTKIGDGGVVTNTGTYQYGFGGSNETLKDYLGRIAGEMGEGKRFEMSPVPLSDTGVQVKRVRKKRK